jgi:hypothetical protein
VPTRIDPRTVRRVPQPPPEPEPPK